MFFLPSPRIIMFSPSFRWFVGLSADYAETYLHKTLIGGVFLSRRDPVNSSWGSPDYLRIRIKGRIQNISFLLSLTLHERQFSDISDKFLRE